jgi:hypothetical protein
MASVKILSANGDTTFTLEQFVNQQAAECHLISDDFWCVDTMTNKIVINSIDFTNIPDIEQVKQKTAKRGKL